MAAIVGAAGLAPTLTALRQGTIVALANKECLVSAGSLFMSEAARHGATLVPVDSEHSAVFQSLDEVGSKHVERIVLTASGGPFRTWTREQIAAAKPEDALKHPNWTMGQKITIDSATMMNKGLELIEAFHLFGVRADQLSAIVHPQSIIHALVYYCDGSVIAQASLPDMRTPIAYSLGYPARLPGRCHQAAGPRSRPGLDLRAAGRSPLPRLEARARSAHERRSGGNGAQRRQRGGGGGIPRPCDLFPRDCRHRRGDPEQGRGRACRDHAQATSTR